MFSGSRLGHWVQCVCRRPGLLAILVLSALFTTLYLNSENSILIRYQDISSKYSSGSAAEVLRLYQYAWLPELVPSSLYSQVNTMDDATTHAYRARNNLPTEIPVNYLVLNPKCRILARDPLDRTIRKFVKKEKFESCRKTPLLTRIIETQNGQSVLKLDQKLIKNHPGLSCSWAPINRSKPTKLPNFQTDSKVDIGSLANLTDEAIVPKMIEVVVVKCKEKNTKVKAKGGGKTIYANAHPVIWREKVKERIEQNNTSNGKRKLSVLLLGMDNVSRLNSERSMPKTTSYLRDTGWIELRGYNKVADNTFPNLMALLTGMNNSRAYDICKPTQPAGLDDCPLIWRAFRNASYVTAYGEDATAIGTFNYMKAGFANPPTDFYLRPYMIAAEKYLELKRYLGTNTYCTGPEPSGIRILNYAVDFARKFIGVPYFGLFWTNTMSHDNVNGPSSVDDYMLSVLERLGNEGILNDSMVVFLSDHGLRYGPLRETTQGWFEEKLPLIHISLPEWFREEDPESVESLRDNGRSLTSPYNLYETLRDILDRAGGHAEHTEACTSCRSLFTPGPGEIGCEDVGVPHQWCACTTLENFNISTEIALEAGRQIVRHIDNLAKVYTDSNGRRLCAKLKLKQVIMAQGIVESGTKNGDSEGKQFVCQVRVTPGDGKFEATMRYSKNGNVTMIGEEVTRINTYSVTGKCLKVGMKQYCFCG